jgi:hypothetical protein
MSNDFSLGSLRHTLTNLAKGNPTRKDFNAAVKRAFPVCLGEGAFRKVYEAGDLVIKVRRHEPRRCNPHPQYRIDAANSDEMKGYKDFCKTQPVLSRLVLPPTYFCLPNNHDAIIMEKMENTWEGVGCRGRMDIEENNTALHNQIQVIQEIFSDAHGANIGFKGKRAYLIDFNFTDTWGIDRECKMNVRRVLEAVGEKFRGRKPKQVLQAQSFSA